MGDGEESYMAELRAALARARAEGLEGREFSRALAGADPRLVHELLQAAGDLSQPVQHDTRRHEARRLSAELPLLLPAPNPVLSQWWFTLDAAESLSARAHSLAMDGEAVFLGAPTVGYHHAIRYDGEAAILDADPDVVASMQTALKVTRPQGCLVDAYDVYDQVPAKYKARYTVAVVDPPWYPASTRLFLSRAREMIRGDGFILCAVPPLLTRPGILEERQTLLSDLLELNYQLESLEPQILAYEVPSFELAAYQDLPAFTGRTWRDGDLLTLRVHERSRPLPLPDLGSRFDVICFSRDPSKLRFFLSESRVDPDLPAWASPIAEFEQTVSARAVNTDGMAAWGSNQRGIRARDAPVVRAVLEGWQRRDSESVMIAGLSATMPTEQADAAVTQICAGLRLDPSDPGASWRRPPSVMEEKQRELLSELASTPSVRQYQHSDDDFRLAFQRDRDRILWSRSLKQLAEKTQVLPVNGDEQLRRRLTHSVEVLQLASTIARAFGLDPDLTEAGALAHDLGHPPFGHAGEYALNSILNQVAPKLGGFNHYEHGADVVRWLEDSYASQGIGGFPGLNLTPETVECILKHTYFRAGDVLGQTEVLSRSKHRDIITDSSGSLEAQSVRMADKISYLISDLEDGIRLGIITADDLRACRLFDRPPIDMQQVESESLIQRFISQRRAVLRVLMEDILVATDFRLATLGSLQAVRDQRDYTVALSPAIQDEVDEVWLRLQAGRLHTNGQVVRANLQAGARVTDLFLLYVMRPELVADEFRATHSRLEGSKYLDFYREANGGNEVGLPKRMVSALALDRMIGARPKSEGDNFKVRLCDVILAKDYVASMTDRRALVAHADLIA